MALPTKIQISNAVEHLSQSSLTPQLNGYTHEVGLLGPEQYSGGFCVVFPIHKKTHKKALRLWYAEIDNVKYRYESISKDIQTSALPFLAKVEYIASAINVDGQEMDAVLMDWIDGIPIKEYIQTIIDNMHLDLAGKQQALLFLAQNLLHVFQQMHQYHFAHGDLQHDNILITSNNTIKLIDYDNFYTPSFGQSFLQTTIGYAGYQHPILRTRGKQITSEKEDYFSELIIYLSVVALSRDLSLWDIVKDEEWGMLFAEEDFYDIIHSTIWGRLIGLGDDIRLLLTILENYLSKTCLEDLEPFDILLDRMTKEPEIHSFVVSCGEGCLIGDKVTFTWKVEHYTQLLLNGVDVTALTSVQYSVDKSTNYVLEVHNGLKSIQQTLRIEAYPVPQVVFNTDKNKLHKGKNESITLSWQVKDAEKITLWQDPAAIQNNCTAEGNYTCPIGEKTNFTLSVLALDKKTTIDKSLSINVYPEATFSFSADKEYVFPSIPFTLSWNTQNAKSVSLNGNKVPLNGQSVIDKGINKETTYTLRITDDFGTKEQSVTIRLLPMPRIEIQVPTVSIQTAVPTINMPIPQIHLEAPYVQIKQPSLDITQVRKHKPITNLLACKIGKLLEQSYITIQKYIQNEQYK